MKSVKLGGKSIYPPFTIPSGIITVSPDLIVKVAEEIGIGLVTAKSVGVEPRDGYSEPLFSQYSQDSISSAVGLSNPGVDAWTEEMRGFTFPAEKFFLVSIFADTTDDYVELARRVSPLCEGVELNFCCPHSLRYGAVVAVQEQLTVEITKAVRQAIDKVIVVKLTPDGPEIGQWARKLVDAGADAIAAIGPTKAVTVLDEHTRVPILSYGSGGLSGPAILERGIESVRRIRRHVDVPIIGGGGIRGARDVKAYAEAGANIFSIGTSLAGLDTPGLKLYFDTLLSDLENNTDHSSDMTFNRWILNYVPMTVRHISRQDDYAVIEFDGALDAGPGQFIFAWLPGVGEKPFGVARTDPFTMGVKRVGRVSSALYNLKPGQEVMVKGPFGRAYPTKPKTVIVAGGCGAVPLRLLAERCVDPIILLGGRTSEDLLFLDDFKKLGKVIASTEDGSVGTCGTVVDSLRGLLSSGDWSHATFCNCGPEQMMVAAANLERLHADPSRIYLGIERHTSCGIGLCGKCALDGYRTCIDGPVMTLDQLSEDGDFGHYHREACGKRLRL